MFALQRCCLPTYGQSTAYSKAKHAMCLYFGTFEKHKLSALENNVSPYKTFYVEKNSQRETNMFQLKSDTSVRVRVIRCIASFDKK